MVKTREKREKINEKKEMSFKGKSNASTRRSKKKQKVEKLWAKSTNKGKNRSLYVNWV